MLLRCSLRCSDRISFISTEELSYITLCVYPTLNSLRVGLGLVENLLLELTY